MNVGCIWVYLREWVRRGRVEPPFNSLVHQVDLLQFNSGIPALYSPFSGPSFFGNEPFWRLLIFSLFILHNDIHWRKSIVSSLVRSSSFQLVKSWVTGLNWKWPFNGSLLSGIICNECEKRHVVYKNGSRTRANLIVAEECFTRKFFYNPLPIV